LSIKKSGYINKFIKLDYDHEKNNIIYCNEMVVSIPNNDYLPSIYEHYGRTLGSHVVYNLSNIIHNNWHKLLYDVDGKLILPTKTVYVSGVEYDKKYIESRISDISHNEINYLKLGELALTHSLFEREIISPLEWYNRNSISHLSYNKLVTLRYLCISRINK
jgi:hypothetical protein